MHDKDQPTITLTVQERAPSYGRARHASMGMSFEAHGTPDRRHASDGQPDRILPASAITVSAPTLAIWCCLVPRESARKLGGSPWLDENLYRAGVSSGSVNGTAGRDRPEDTDQPQLGMAAEGSAVSR